MRNSCALLIFVQLDRFIRIGVLYFSGCKKKKKWRSHLMSYMNLLHNKMRNTKVDHSSAIEDGMK